MDDEKHCHFRKKAQYKLIQTYLSPAIITRLLFKVIDMTMSALLFPAEFILHY